MYDNNGIVVLGSHSLNECITAMPCSQIFSIVKFSVTQADNDHHTKTHLSPSLPSTVM